VSDVTRISLTAGQPSEACQRAGTVVVATLNELPINEGMSIVLNLFVGGAMQMGLSKEQAHGLLEACWDTKARAGGS